MDVLSILVNYGISTILAPFLLVYTLIYGLLRKTNLFSGQTQKINSIIAFSLALYFVYKANTVEATQKFLSVFFLGILTLFMFLIAISFILQNRPGLILTGWLGIAWFIALMYAVFYSPESVESLTYSVWDIVQTYIINTGALIIIIFLLSFFILYKWLTGTGPRMDKEKVKKAFAVLMDEDTAKEFLREKFRENR